MNTRSLIALAVLFAAGMRASPAAQDPAPSAPAVEQLALVAYGPCTGANPQYSPPCESSMLADLDGSHAMAMPLGEWSPDGRQLLLNWSGEIHVTSATGGTSVNLTNHPANDSAPRWSRDGARIAFTSNRDGARDLYVMNADGSDVLRLNTGVPIASAPAWSPDGTRVVFSCAADPLAPANYDICAINIDGTSFARLTSGPGYEYEPDWSPDGSRIIFTDETDGAHLVMINPAGGDLTVVNHIWLAEHPRWSPDGTRFAFVNFFWPEDVETARTRFVTIMNADGSGAGSQRWGDWPIWRPFSSGINYRPAASFSFQCDGPTCTLDASGSADADGIVAEYGWRFADGTTAAGPTVTRTFGLLDRWVSLRVMDDDAALGESGKSVNRPPVAAFTVSCAGRACTFDGSSTTDPDGNIRYFSWSFGDGQYGSGQSVSHTYAYDGTFGVSLGVTDYTDSVDNHRETVVVGTGNNPPLATFSFTCSQMVCHFDGSGSSDTDPGVLTYAWSFGDGTTGTGVIKDHTYAAAGSYPVVLTVTDAGGLTATETASVSIAPPAPPLPGYLHAGNLTGATSTEQKTWTSTVKTLVHDATHKPVTGALVTGVWDTGNTGSCETGPGGDCAISQPGLAKKFASATFAVRTISRTGYLYAAASNHDPDGGSTGTTIKVVK